VSANADDIPPWERKAPQATPAAENDTPPWERKQPQAAAAPEKPSVDSQLWTVAKEFVPAFGKAVAGGMPDAPVVETAHGAMPFAGPTEMAGSYPVAQSEHEKYKKYNQAVDFAVRNPA
jgi:hypothetical protein